MCHSVCKVVGLELPRLITKTPNTGALHGITAQFNFATSLHLFCNGVCLLKGHQTIEPISCPPGLNMLNQGRTNSMSLSRQRFSLDYNCFSIYYLPARLEHAQPGTWIQRVRQSHWPDLDKAGRLCQGRCRGTWFIKATTAREKQGSSKQGFLSIGSQGSSRVRLLGGCRKSCLDHSAVNRALIIVPSIVPWL